MNDSQPDPLKNNGSPSASGKPTPTTDNNMPERDPSPQPNPISTDMNIENDPNSPTGEYQPGANTSPPAAVILTNGVHPGEPVTAGNDGTAPAASVLETQPDTVTASEANQSNETSIDASSAVTPAEAQPVKKRSRGANPKRDHIWTRHHAICMMGVIADVILGGYEAARNAVEPLKNFPALKDVPEILFELCAWIVNSVSLNFDGSSDFNKLGLWKCYLGWASNRLHYFYRTNERNEHPANRVRSNLSAVYRQFYDAFHQDVAARTPISEERARDFWLSVSDRVPFQSPVSERRSDNPTAAVTATTDIHEAHDAATNGEVFDV